MKPPHVLNRLRDAVFAAHARMEVKSLMYALIHRADGKTLECTPSIPTIARDAGMEEQTARKWLEALVACGAVTRRDRSDGARQMSPVWQVVEAELRSRLEGIPQPKRGGVRVSAADGGGKDPTGREDATGGKDHTTPVPNTPPGVGASLGQGWGQTPHTNTISEHDQRTRSLNPPACAGPGGGAAPSPTGSHPLFAPAADTRIRVGRSLVPPDLLALLSAGIAPDGRMIEGIRRVGNVSVQHHLLDKAIESTEVLLRKTRADLKYDGVKSSIIDELERYLPVRWGDDCRLSALAAPAPTPAPRSRDPGDAIAVLAARRRERDGPPIRTVLTPSTLE